MHTFYQNPPAKLKIASIFFAWTLASPSFSAPPLIPSTESPLQIPSIDKSSGNNALQPWYTYKVNSKDPLLMFWLMKLAPGSKVAPEEIPFRKALVETLLSPEFQPYVSLDWEEENEPYMKTMRAKFCTTYMERVDWSATPFERLFMTEKKDLHQVNEEAYLYGYHFPLNLGVRAYKDEDFPLGGH